MRRTLRQYTPFSFLLRRWKREAARYRVKRSISTQGEIPLVWWPVAPNFGDAASPWLVRKMTGVPVVKASDEETNYLAVGSIIKRATPESIVWGSGAFGTEKKKNLEPEADYRAVRGPLTRQIMENYKIRVPAVYGDPALLAPLYFYPKVKKKYDIGVVVRWSERSWHEAVPGDGVTIIDLNTNDVEKVIKQMLECRKIISSSLHGLIFADAYGIPNAWRRSETGNGGIYKYFDYFASVNKFRNPHSYDISKRGLALKSLRRNFSFDARKIVFNHKPLLDACPFLEKVS